MAVGCSDSVDNVLSDDWLSEDVESAETVLESVLSVDEAVSTSVVAGSDELTVGATLGV